MKSVGDSAGKPWVVLKEPFHLLPVPRKNKHNFPYQVFDFSKEEIQNRLATMIMALGQLVSFVNEIDTTVGVFKSFQVVLDLSDTTMCQTRTSCLDEAMSGKDLE